MSTPRLSQKEKDLFKNMTLEQYKELVYNEAKRRLQKNHQIKNVCVTHLRRIETKDNFESDVNSIVDDSISYA